MKILCTTGFLAKVAFWLLLIGTVLGTMLSQ